MSNFASIVGIPVGIASSAVEINICAIGVVNKTYKSIIQVLISKALIDSTTDHVVFFPVNNLLNLKKKSKDLKIPHLCQRFLIVLYTI